MLLQRIERHRFVRTTDLYRLFPHRTPDKLSRRLARLYRAGLLDRPPAQIDYFRGKGSQPLIYGLDAAGVRLLANSKKAIGRADDIRARNRRYTRENLDHTLAVANFLIGVELACTQYPGLTFIAEEQVVRSVPRSWQVTLPWRRHEATVQVAPDAIFGLRRKDGERELKSFFLLEIDRGTMTVVPSQQVRESQAFLYRSSILRKLFAYAISHKDRVHQQQLSVHAARVLLVTSSAARAEQMRAAAAQLVVKQAGVPPELFLFGQDCDLENFVDAGATTTSLSEIASASRR